MSGITNTGYSPVTKEKIEGKLHWKVRNSIKAITYSVFPTLSDLEQVIKKLETKQL